jgi:hypothetical protein
MEKRRRMRNPWLARGEKREVEQTNFDKGYLTGDREGVRERALDDANKRCS